MSISNISRVSANSNVNSLGVNLDSRKRADDLPGGSESARLSDVSTTEEMLTERQTDLDRLIRSTTTLERMSGSPAMYPQTETFTDQIVLAQKTSLFPDPLIQDFRQHIQPVQDPLEGVLGEPRQPDLPGQPALDLISQHRETIWAVSSEYGVDPMQVASIIFQEKFYGAWADAKNLALAWPQIAVGGNNASIGMAEMDINTAATLLDIDPATMSSQQRDDIIDILSNDESAIGLIAANIVSFEGRLGRDVTLQEATHGHNVGIETLMRELPIEIGSPTSRRSWEHQDSIASALGLL